MDTVKACLTGASIIVSGRQVANRAEQLALLRDSIVHMCPATDKTRVNEFLDRIHDLVFDYEGIEEDCRDSFIQNVKDAALASKVGDCKDIIRGCLQREQERYKKAVQPKRSVSSKAAEKLEEKRDNGYKLDTECPYQPQQYSSE